MRPFLLAALNTEPAEASRRARRRGAAREPAGGRGRLPPAHRQPDLAAAFIDPALAFLAARGAKVRLGQRLRGSPSGPPRRRARRFPDARCRSAARRGGPRGAALDGARAGARISSRPTNFAPSSMRISRSRRRAARPPCSACSADRRMAVRLPRPHLGDGERRRRDRGRRTAKRSPGFCGGRRRGATASAALPPWQIVKEKRATFAATPAQDASGRARARAGATCFSPATGPRRACPRRSRARCVPATRRRAWRCRHLAL